MDREPVARKYLSSCPEKTRRCGLGDVSGSFAFVGYSTLTVTWHGRRRIAFYVDLRGLLTDKSKGAVVCVRLETGAVGEG